MDISFKKPSMKKRGSSGRTIVCYCLDESSSMMDKIDSVVNGLNEYVDTLKSDDSEILFCLTKFNTQAEVVYAVEPLQKVKKFTNKNYSPNGMTALIDAVGMTIKAVDEVVEDDDRVLFAIMTDGAENSSREFKSSDIEKLIKGRTEDGWEFVYFGADQSAWSVAGSWGISAGNTMVYTNDTAGMKTAMHTHAHSTVNYLSGDGERGNYFVKPSTHSHTIKTKTKTKK